MIFFRIWFMVTAFMVFIPLGAYCEVENTVVDEQTTGGELIDGLVAQVNDEFIVASDVLAALEPFRSRAVNLYSGRELELELNSAFSNIVERLIENKLILVAYKNQERQLPEVMIEERADEIIREAFAGDRNALMKELSKAYMTYEQWLEQIRDDMVLSFMRRMRVDQNVSIAPAQLRKFYEEHREDFQKKSEVRLQMIVLSADKDGKPASDRASLVVKKLDKGRPFTEVAKSFSDGSNAGEGGDWGWVDADNLRKEIREALKKLRPGKVSGPIHINDSIFFTRLVEKRGGDKLSFPEAKESIRKEIEARQKAEIYKKWISTLKKTAVVRKLQVKLF